MNRQDTLRRLLQTIACLTGLALLAAAFSTGWPNSTATTVTGDSGLSIPADCLNFGMVWEDRHFKLTLPIDNRGRHDMHIDSFSSSCTCLSTEPQPLTIPAGQRRDLRLTLNLAAREPGLDDSEWRDFKVVVRPQLGGDKKGTIAPDWIIVGKVHTALRLDKNVLAFGRHSESAQPLRPQKFSVDGFVPLAALTARTNTPLFRAEVERRAKESDTFDVTVSPAILPRGQFHFELSITPHAIGNDNLPSRVLPITGWVVSDYEASPADTVFGAMRLGETGVDFVTLSSLTGRRFGVIAVKVHGDGLSVERVESTDAVVYRLQQRITKVGQQSGIVEFQLKTSDEELDSIRVPISYLGLPAPD
jgi:hypothetical protein